CCHCNAGLLEKGVIVPVIETVWLSWKQTLLISVVDGSLSKPICRSGPIGEILISSIAKSSAHNARECSSVILTMNLLVPGGKLKLNPKPVQRKSGPGVV